jgi:hypothetical protein
MTERWPLFGSALVVSGFVGSISNAYLAAGRTTQRAVRLSTEAEARTALRYAMAQTGAALDGESNTDLAQALSDLRSAGGRLTRILSRNDGE